MTAEPPPQNPSTLDKVWRQVAHFQRYFSDFAGVLLLALALMSILALLFPHLASGILYWWAHLLSAWFGWGAAWPVLAIGLVGIWLLRRRQPGEQVKINWLQLLAVEIAVFTSLIFLTSLGGISLSRAQQGLDGGRIGWGLAELLRFFLRPIGLSSSIVVGLIGGSCLLISAMVGFRLYAPLSFVYKRLFGHSKAATPGLGFDPAIAEAPLVTQEIVTTTPAGVRKKRFAIPQEFRKNFRLSDDVDTKPVVTVPRAEDLPSLNLLSSEQAYRPDERNINQLAGMIEKTLFEFGIPAKVVGYRVGPTVTQFAVEPGFIEKDKTNGENDAVKQKVRVAQISALSRDLALALSAERLRIEAPVAGRPYVGIEVPNARATVVRLRPILESEAFSKVSSPLSIVLGRDVSGQPVVADLGKMPHLLMAGTTGSGKSICIEALTTCLVMNNSPEELRLVMIDPKMVELVRFNGLPHLLGKVETDLERILAVLRWTVAEMDRRYKILEASRSRNLDTYNRKARRRQGAEVLPRIVVMIDELADLMMSAPDETEHNLVRLAQMARATGIHLVVATQRPGTEVVTGLIKANFPARISFMVASSVDSRVILDTGGAENLLGRGDMLFVPPDASAPIRAQGVMVSDQEIEHVITYWQKAASASPTVVASPWEALLAVEETMAGQDSLVVKATQIIRETGRASASLLQRRLRIGYPRAARLMDELEEAGVIGPAQGGGREREILIERNDEESDLDGD